MAGLKMTFELAMCWAALGLTAEVIFEIRRDPSQEHARARLAGVKEEAKRRYRQLALVHHPDRGGDAELFKLLAPAYEALEKLDVRPAPPPPMMGNVAVYVVRSSWSSASSSATTSTNTASGFAYWR